MSAEIRIAFDFTDGINKKDIGAECTPGNLLTFSELLFRLFKWEMKEEWDNLRIVPSPNKKVHSNYIMHM